MLERIVLLVFRKKKKPCISNGWCVRSKTAVSRFKAVVSSFPSSIFLSSEVSAEVEVAGDASRTEA